MPEQVLDILSEPSPHSSSSNTTPVTDNLGVVAGEERDLPETAKQPILGSLFPGPTFKMDASSVPVQDTASPRSIDMKRTLEGSIPQRISISPQNIPPARPQGRRTHSEENLFRSHESQQQPYGSYKMAPPSYGLPPQQMLPSPRVLQAAPRPRRTPPTGPHGPSHHRSRSWNAQSDMMGMQGLSPAGNPLIPVLQDPGAVRDMVGMQGISPAGNPLIPVLQDPGAGREAFVYGSASPIQGHRKRSYHEQFSRPRSNSMSGVPIHPVYGSVSDAPPPPPSGTAPPPQQQQQRLRSEKWSPRSEIMSLTKGFNSRRSSPPISPNMNAGNNYRSMSPRRSPSNAALRAGHMTRHDGVHVKFSSSTNLDHPFSATASTRGIQPWQHEFDSIPAWESDSLLGTGGGEAAFYGKNRGKRSNRKMHMRQRSAQLFMEDIKGVQQPPVCRDVLFVLLFLFHLVGIVYLGTTYGSEATERDQAVTLSYHNVTYMACLCGAFAVIVSTIALVIVMTITKKIIQLALFLTIALSFAWGTIGIGLSPKNFVPITGIIALALSVGYAFVVWDRIPFAAANLHAGLRAVRANMGIVLVAFIFQGLALGWTIYYTFVVVGVYDALDVGDLVLTDKMKVFVYSMLGISFYWTFHVLMVRLYLPMDTRSSQTNHHF
jgi:hypothetical protein